MFSWRRESIARDAGSAVTSILGRFLRCCGAVIFGALLAAFVSPAAQAPAPAQPSQPAPPSSANPQADGSSGGANANGAPAAANYNPLPAEKDVEVATFYERKGDLDAAIPRLEEAIKLKPDYAKPRLLLGEIYEKKGDKQNAVKYYSDYLRVYPHAPDAKKIRAKIGKLSGQ
jgi:tetratricopeptide (TPR) repeat protein